LTAEKASGPLPEALLKDESGHAVADVECDESDKGTQKRAHRMCGLSTRVFWIIVAFILIAAIIAGVVGGILGSKAKHSTM
jgi:hypothetical protein